MLRRKLFRDLWQNKTQFISIFLMAFLGMFIFAGMDADSNGMGVSTNDYYEQTDLADDWVVSEHFSTDEVHMLEQLDCIQSVDRKLVIDAKAQIDGEEYDMELNFIDTMNCSFPYLYEGEPFSADKEGIWLEDSFAKQWKLQVGDYIRLKYEGKEFQEEIKGIIIHPEYIFYTLDGDSVMPNYGKYGFGYLSREEFPIQEKLVFNRLVIKQNPQVPVSTMTFKDLVKNTLDRDDIVVLDRTQNVGIEAIASEKEQHEAMGIMFSAVFLLIAVMGIVTTMTRMTSNQRIQIGTLKALGFSKATITWHYVSYGLFISLAGAILGSIAGYFCLPPIFRPNMSSYYILPKWTTQISIKSYIAILLTVMIDTIVSFLSCRRELRDMPAVTLKPAAPKNMKHFRLEKSRIWLTMGFSTQWNIRDILRNKARSFMGVAGVAGCTMLMLCALGCKNSCDEIAEWQYGELTIGKQKVTFAEELSSLEKREYRQRFNGQLVQEGSCEFKTGERIKTGNITIMESGNYMRYQDDKGREIKFPQTGIGLSYKMANLLGVKEGDFIEWHMIGEEDWERNRVSFIYRTPTGQGIAMTQSQFEELDYDFEPTVLYTNMSIPAYVKDSDDITGVSSLSQQKKDLRDNMEMLNIMVIVLITAAVILGVIVLYNMGVLSFMEKTREVATLKVLGFTSARIRKILQQQNVWLTIVGIGIGLVLGYILLDAITQTMSEDNDIPAVIYTLSYVYSIIGTLVISVSVNRILSSKVKTICMVDALKGVE